MASGKQPTYLFFGEIPKGHVFKIIVDLLNVSIQKTDFTVTNAGLFHRGVDNPKLNRILIDASFPREKFKNFECTAEFSFSVNLKHLKTNVRNVKKKDVLTLYILVSDPNKLHIHIKAAKSNKKKEEKLPSEVKKVAKKSKTTVIDHCDITLKQTHELMPLPDFYIDDKGKSVNAYGYPKVIDSPDFQKIKKMTTTSKELDIEMVGHSYIKFYSTAGGLYGSQVTIGDDSDSDDDEANDNPNKDKKYEASFHMSLIQPLMKLPTLSTHMQFYAPLIEGHPLKVKVDAGNIATATVYLKDIKRIEYEEQMNEDQQRAN
jgi:hypothetical protein